MNDDPIVTSVRRVRDQLAAKFDYDVHAIFTAMRVHESQVGRRLVKQEESTSKTVPPCDGGLVAGDGESLPTLG